MIMAYLILTARRIISASRRACTTGLTRESLAMPKNIFEYIFQQQKGRRPFALATVEEVCEFMPRPYCPRRRCGSWATGGWRNLAIIISLLNLTCQQLTGAAIVASILT